MSACLEIIQYKYIIKCIVIYIKKLHIKYILYCRMMSAVHVIYVQSIHV